MEKLSNVSDQSDVKVLSGFGTGCGSVAKPVAFGPNERRALRLHGGESSPREREREGGDFSCESTSHFLYTKPNGVYMEWEASWPYIQVPVFREGYNTYWVEWRKQIRDLCEFELSSRPTYSSRHPPLPPFFYLILSEEFNLLPRVPSHNFFKSTFYETAIPFHRGPYTVNPICEASYAATLT